ncbi:hypothetical protein BT67DRAFT_379454 [Trichocladium antarcticum]|uniref:Uncharacterized protein n=1 Tax=Trichocladium antarcticum TaxID=1450529 RepID=A0AAN6UK54_9PEZI|nr:hypothetical protein BT67DRAFT_379454 [Trichocladium antarcticum]
MELHSGDDLISLKESLQSHHSPSTESPPSINADEYARDSGLTIDSLLFDWPRLVDHDPSIASTVADIAPGQLIEDGELQECLFRAIIPAPEQWQMPVASLQILQQVCGRCKDEDVAALASQQCLSETLTWKGLKLEPPELRSDHGIDCRQLAHRVKVFLKEQLPEHRLPLHPSDPEQGEALEFSRNMAEMDREQMRTVEKENLEVHRDTLVYLMQSLKSNWTDEEQQEFVESLSDYEKLGARAPLTPPLSPMAQSFPEYFVPGGESCDIPEPSDSSSRLSADIEEAERRIFESEFEFWTEALQRDTTPGRYEEIDVSGMIRAGDFRTTVHPSSPEPVSRDLRVDVPLLPWSENNDSGQSSARALGSDDLEEARGLVVSSDTLSGSDGPTGQLVRVFQKQAATVMRCVEQERLQPLDAIARVPVPVMDFSIPIPEWEERLWEAKAIFSWIRETVEVDWQGPKWPNNRAAEQRLVWAPLAHMKEKKLVSECIEMEPRTFDFFLKRSRDAEVPSSADYVYKHPGLAILRVGEYDDDDDDDEDYLTPLDSSRQSPTNPSQTEVWRKTAASSLVDTALALQPNPRFTTTAATPPPQDLATLLSGRKLLIDETIQKRQLGKKRDRDSVEPDQMSGMGIIDPALIASTNVLRGFMSEYTDFAPLVDNFVEMNFPKKPKLTHSSFFDPPTTAPTTQPKTTEAARLMPPPSKPIPALSPSITPPNPPPRIVISSTLSRLLTSRLETLLPGIELIPRNHNSTNEADLVVSPATGVLLTTMISLRQKPVPATPGGNSTATAGTDFGRATANVAARHERLVVLVSEGNKHSETASPLSQADAKALAGLQGFAAGLPQQVRVVYVGGGVETLARWVAGVVCDCHGREAAAVRELLLPVETFWEGFLRRAGMNVWAAQVVLGRLRVPDGELAVGGPGGQVYGLPLFVMMSRERRVELFAEAFGGRTVLDRVSEAIDKPWGQGAVDDGNFGYGGEMVGWQSRRGLH